MYNKSQHNYNEKTPVSLVHIHVYMYVQLERYHAYINIYYIKNTLFSIRKEYIYIVSILIKWTMTESLYY